MKKLALSLSVFLLVSIVGTGLVLAQYAVCPPAQINSPVEKKLSSSFCNFEQYKVDKVKKHLDAAEKLLDQVLKEDPGNPIALNNMAAIKIEQGKLDKADTLLGQALESLKKKPCLVRLNRVCDVKQICVAIEPVKMGEGNQDLEPMVKFNKEMVGAMMARIGSATPKPQ